MSQNYYVASAKIDGLIEGTFIVLPNLEVRPTSRDVVNVLKAAAAKGGMLSTNIDGQRELEVLRALKNFIRDKYGVSFPGYSGLSVDRKVTIKEKL